MKYYEPIISHKIVFRCGEPKPCVKGLYNNCQGLVIYFSVHMNEFDWLIVYYYLHKAETTVKYYKEQFQGKIAKTFH